MCDQRPANSNSQFLEKIYIEHLDQNCKQKLITILESHSDKVKNDTEATLKIPVKHQIHLKNYAPVALPARPIPYSQRSEIEKQIKDLQQQGIITPSTSFYSVLIVTMQKPDGTLRICIDYRLLNSKTILVPFPIPRLNELLDRLKGSKYFTVVDIENIKCGFWDKPHTLVGTSNKFCDSCATPSYRQIEGKFSST